MPTTRHNRHQHLPTDKLANATHCYRENQTYGFTLPNHTFRRPKGMVSPCKTYGILRHQSKQLTRQHVYYSTKHSLPPAKTANGM